MINKELQQQLRKAGYKGDFSLSSLIDACGDKIQLAQKIVGDRDTVWKYSAYEIAVAKLFIKLNDKS